MARLSLDQLEQMSSSTQQPRPKENLKFEFFKLENNLDTCRIRFMYGPGESFEALSVHEIYTGEFQKKKKYVSCLREPGQPASVCPLCLKGYKQHIKFYIPCYDVDNNKVLLWERGKMYEPFLKGIIAQRQGRPLVSAIFQIKRIGEPGSKNTNYLPEFISEDDTTLEMLPPRPNADGILVLNRTADEMQQFINTGVLPTKQQGGNGNNNYNSFNNFNNPGVVPRTPYQPAQQMMPQQQIPQQQIIPPPTNWNNSMIGPGSTSTTDIPF